jgi:hypothetical protein
MKIHIQKFIRYLVFIPNKLSEVKLDYLWTYAVELESINFKFKLSKK